MHNTKPKINGVPRCFRWVQGVGQCKNPGVDKYANPQTVSYCEPVCPEHQFIPERKDFFDLLIVECSELSEEQIIEYARDGHGEEMVRAQVDTCKKILERIKPSGAPKKHARDILIKKILDAMITADPCLSDEDVWKSAAKTVEHYKKKYCDLS